MVPERQPYDPALAVGAAHGVVVERLVFFCRTAKKPDFGGIEEAAREYETGAAVRGERFGGQRSTCHIRMRVNQWLEPVKTARPFDRSPVEKGPRVVATSLGVYPRPAGSGAVVSRSYAKIA